MSIDLKNTNSKDYWKQVNKLFAICRKKKVNPNEIQLLAKYPYLRNKKGQNLIMYALEKSPNLNIVNFLLNNGHNILKDDIYDVFVYIIDYYKNHEDHIIFIIDYMIENNIIDKIFITKYIKRIINIKTTYKFVKTIIDKDVLTKDLGDFYIYKKTTNVDIIKIFYDNFNITKCEDILCKVFEQLNVDILDNINDDYIKYLIDNSKVIEKQSLIYILEIFRKNSAYVYTINYIDGISKLLNKIYSITKIYDTKYWEEFMDTIMLDEPTFNKKNMFNIGLMTGNIKDFPVNLIRGFDMDGPINSTYLFSDNKFKVNSYSDRCLMCIETVEILKNLINKYNIHPLFLFKEDIKYLYPNMTDYQFNKLNTCDIIGTVNLSKKYCIEKKKKILESLHN